MMLISYRTEQQHHGFKALFESSDFITSIVFLALHNALFLFFYIQAWAFKFFFCECLNFVNVVVQIVLTDWFLGGEFSTYGLEVTKLRHGIPHVCQS